ncbi:MAG: hypothetical protein Q9188_002346 [Gyalolechia gomerana]
MFQDKESWPMKDASDPLAGWSWKEVFTSEMPAKNDIYGHLCAHLYDTLLQFCQICRGLKITVRLFQADVLQLPDLLTGSGRSQEGFDRIEARSTDFHQVSNVADRCYVGTEAVLTTFGPLLRPSNPCATLIALYLNAVQDASTPFDKVSMSTENKRTQKYLPIDPQLVFIQKTSDADYLRFDAARFMFRDVDVLFDRYMLAVGFEGVAKSAGLVMKDRNTIVRKWPMRLGPKATQDEFDHLLASAHNGSERYVEWKTLV